MPPIPNKMRIIDTGGVYPLYLEERHLDSSRVVTVVRDDLILGGTKARVIPLLFDDQHEEYVYASPVQGYAQVALAHACVATGKRATIVCAERRSKHPLTKRVLATGAKLVEIGPPAFLTVVSKRAADYCKQTGAKLLPFGLGCKEIIDGLIEVAKKLPEPPTEIWSVVASGTLSKALQTAWPDVPIIGVRVGAIRDFGRAVIHHAPEKYEQDAKSPPPFPSCPNYDAKAWQLMRQFAKPGALFWNVAG